MIYATQQRIDRQQRRSGVLASKPLCKHPNFPSGGREVPVLVIRYVVATSEFAGADKP